jgi:ATP-dependent DNA helicase RecG
MDFTAPPVRARFDQQRCRNQDGEMDSLLVIRVDPSEVVHEMTNGEVYLRVGAESRRLGFTARQELQFDKGQSQYDGQPAPGVGVEVLDEGLIKNYRSRTGATGTTKQLLSARSLLTPKGELTNGGYLLFAAYPQLLFPQAYIRVIKFLWWESRSDGWRC